MIIAYPDDPGPLRTPFPVQLLTIAEFSLRIAPQNTNSIISSQFVPAVPVVVNPFIFTFAPLLTSIM
ncbi:MAG TPA: hypothetical protein VF222_02730 [Nitrososphaeraceae archaeon]